MTRHTYTYKGYSQSGVGRVLLWTSLVGSLIGFVVCYLLFVKLQLAGNRFNMRIFMMNSMSLAFIFAMFVELTTGSKGLAIVTFGEFWS